MDIVYKNVVNAAVLFMSNVLAYYILCHLNVQETPHRSCVLPFGVLIFAFSISISGPKGKIGNKGEEGPKGRLFSVRGPPGVAGLKGEQGLSSKKPGKTGDMGTKGLVGKQGAF